MQRRCRCARLPLSRPRLRLRVLPLVKSKRAHRHEAKLIMCGLGKRTIRCRKRPGHSHWLCDQEGSQMSASTEGSKNGPGRCLHSMQEEGAHIKKTAQARHGPSAIVVVKTMSCAWVHRARAA